MGAWLAILLLIAFISGLEIGAITGKARRHD